MPTRKCPTSADSNGPLEACASRSPLQLQDRASASKVLCWISQVFVQCRALARPKLVLVPAVYMCKYARLSTPL